MAEPTTSSTRKSKTDYIMKLWSHLQTRIQSIMNEETTFEQLTTFMADSKNIKLTASFYTMLSSFCNKEPIQKNSINSNNKQSPNIKKARVILSGLLICNFPSDVLDVADIKDLDPSSEACYNSAKHMIQCLLSYDLSKTEMSSPTKLECDDLLKCINQFIYQFDIWKNKDLQKVLDSIINYYEQWMRSYKILEQTSMNEAQKKIILNTLVENMNKTQKRMVKLVGIDKAMQLCQDIKDKVSTETNNIASTTNNQNMKNEDTEEKKEDTLEQELAKKGVPMNMKSGRNLVKQDPKIKNDEDSKDETSKYMKNINGQKMLDLDLIIIEEVSKKYGWIFNNKSI